MSEENVLRMPLRKSKESWFRQTTNGKDNHVPSFNFENFCQVAENEIMKRFDVDPETKQCNMMMKDFLKLENMNVVLEEHQFDQICHLANQDHENPEYNINLPFMTFHGARNINAINSIVKHGYLVAGDKHPTKGWTLGMSHGKIFGEGVYSSVCCDTAEWFSFEDSKSQFTLLVNIVIPGRVIEHETDFEKLRTTEKHFVDLRNVRDENNIYRQQMIKRNPETNTESHEFTGKTGHSISAKKKTGIWVVGEKERIIPFATVTFSSSPNAKNVTPASPWHGLGINFYKFFHVESNQSDKVDDYWFVDPVPQRKNGSIPANGPIASLVTKPRYLICLTSSLAKNPQVVETLEHFTHALGTKSEADNQVHTFLFPFMDSQISKNGIKSAVSRHSKRCKNASIQRLLDPICDWITKDNDNSEFINVVYLFLGKNVCYSEDEIGSVIRKWNTFMRLKQIIIKPIFVGAAVEQPILKWKSKCQTQFFYEQYYHETIASNLGEVCEVLLDENETMMNQIGSLQTLKIPYPGGIAGEGFLSSFQDIQSPSWDISLTSSKSFLLFKGNPPGHLHRSHNLSDNHHPVHIEKMINTANDESNYDQIDYNVRIDNSNYVVENIQGNMMESLARKKARERNQESRQPSKETADEFYIGQQVFLGTSVTVNVTKKADKKALKEDPETRSREIFAETGVIVGKNSRHPSIMIPKLVNSVILSLSGFRNWVFRYPERCKRFLKEITKLGDAMSNLFSTLINDSTHVAYSFIKTSQAQLQKLLSDISCFGNVEFKGKWFQQLRQKRFAKRIVKRMKDWSLPELKSTVRELVPKPERNSIVEPSDALALSSTQIKGLCIRVSRVAASEIEPWLLRVDYVSLTSERQISDIFRAAEEGFIIKDEAGEIISDILPAENCPRNDIRQMAYAYTFTRVPYLYLGSQVAALLVNSWVSVIEQAFVLVLNTKRSKTNVDKAKVAALLDKAFELEPRVKSVMTRDQDMSDLMKKIVSEETFEPFLTTIHGMTSCTRLFGAMITDESPFRDPLARERNSFWSRFCFALLAENTMRECRAKMKRLQKLPDELINKVLDIDMDTNTETWTLNRRNARQLTTNFFFHGYSGCSAFGVVSVLGFLELRFQNKTPDAMADAFISGQISMGSFLKTHLPGFRGVDTQIGLYLQGMKYCRSQLRQDSALIRFDDPERIIDVVSKTQLDSIRSKQQLALRMQDLRNRRLALRLERAEPYRTYHTFPNVFTEAQVQEMNFERIKRNKDKIEQHKREQKEKGLSWCSSDEDLLTLDERIPFTLSTSGLLHYRCCYPDCPDYLKCFMTEKDLETMNSPWPRRHGLWRHLKHDALLGNLESGFHCKAMSLKRRFGDNFEAFVKGMKEAFPGLVEADKEKFQRDITDAFQKYGKKRIFFQADSSLIQNMSSEVASSFATNVKIQS